MSFGPLPSQLCLLSALPLKSIGDKVRFLGCVKAYTLSTATLQLQHRDASHATVTALVDVRLVLERLTSDQRRTGEWVNVMGYVTAILSDNRRPGELLVHVQALLLWSAGALDIQQYQASAQSFQPSLDVSSTDGEDNVP
ncbi:hypothetical protein DL546_006563 [Coniochaeta pulveracea]|uniref:CST complex subunit Ten1 n=1 Tax=Coniochaeta pulveracea TaxID=177199 RepID=A0A420Y9D5_9PEZI|nr:hypothetical protein DL546_006563 [Coniochaeta pulveracea]